MVKKGQRLQWLEAEEDRRLQNAISDSTSHLLKAVEEIGRWVSSDMEGPQPVDAFKICRAYYRRRPSVRSSKHQGESIAHVMEIAARLSKDGKAQAVLGIKSRKGDITDASILKAAQLLYDGKPSNTKITDDEIQTLRRRWEKSKSVWLKWAERIPYSFSAEIKTKELMEKRRGQDVRWPEYMSRRKA